MRITFLKHSGFLVQWPNTAMLFDYIGGELPPDLKNQKLFVFVSHSHADHFSENIFHLSQITEDTEYVLAKQINMSEGRRRRIGLTQNQFEHLHRLSACVQIELRDREGEPIIVKTLRSTDMGVAFLVSYKNRTIYHAGDLNDWQWEGEPEEWNRRMHQKFVLQMESLRDVAIDVAFVPLDPRQGENAPLGLERLLRTANVKHAIPMHMWKQYALAAEWQNKCGDSILAQKLLPVSDKGQIWNLE